MFKIILITVSIALFLFWSLSLLPKCQEYKYTEYWREERTRFTTITGMPYYGKGVPISHTDRAGTSTRRECIRWE